MPRNKNGLKPMGLDKHKLNTPGQTPFLIELRGENQARVEDAGKRVAWAGKNSMIIC